MATEEEFDSWSTASGLVDDITGVITNPYFDYDPEYHDGERPKLYITIQSDDPEIGDNGAHTESYGVGKGWKVVEKGAAVAPEKGGKKKFHENSSYGNFITAAAVTDAIDELRKRGESTVAETWDGLNFRFERQEFKIERKGEEDSSYTLLLPVEFLGIGAKASKPKPAAAAAPAPETPSGASEATSNGDGPISGALLIKLKQAAKNAADHDAFVVEAFTNIDGVEGNAEIEAAVMDASGFYAEHSG